MGYKILMIDDLNSDIEGVKRAIMEAFSEKIEDFFGVNSGPQGAKIIEELGPELSLILLDLNWSSEWRRDLKLAREVVSLETGELPAMPVKRDDLNRQGLAILKYLNKRFTKLPPIVFCSRFGSQELAKQALELGAVAFLDKRDILESPERLFGIIEKKESAESFLRKLQSEFDLPMSRILSQYLLSKRENWVRQWTQICRQLFQHFKTKGSSFLDYTLEVEGVIKKLERENLEPFDKSELLEFLEKREGKREWVQGAKIENFWMFIGEDNRTLRVIPDPAAYTLIEAKTTYQPGESDPLLASKLTRYKLFSDTDPFWGIGELLCWDFPAPDGESWALHREPDSLAPLEAWAGYIRYLSRDDWLHLYRQLTRAFSQGGDRRLYLSPATIFLSYRKGTPQLYIPAISVKPRATEKVRNIDGPETLRAEGAFGKPPQNDEKAEDSSRKEENEATEELQFSSELEVLEYLHAGLLKADTAPTIEKFLQSVEKVRVIKSGWAANSFEREVFELVVSSAKEYSDRVLGDKLSIWFNPTFFYPSLSDEGVLSFWLREFDILLLAPQGILILECKSLRNINSIDTTQVIKQKKAIGKILYPTDLFSKLERDLPKTIEELPSDISKALPPELTEKIEASIKESKKIHKSKLLEIVREFYSPLKKFKQVPLNYQLTEENLERAIRERNREDISPLVSFFVVPKKGDRMRGIISKGELKEVLEKWLSLPPLLNSEEQVQIYQLLEFSREDRISWFREFPGYYLLSMKERDGWELYRAREELSRREVNFLSIPAPPIESTAQLDRYIERLEGYFQRFLENLPVFYQWQDWRGLPANRYYNISRLTIFFRGEVRFFDQYRGHSLRERLTAAIGWLKRGWSKEDIRFLGGDSEAPIPLALSNGDELNFTWLPTGKEIFQPLISAKHSAAVREIRKRVLNKIISLFNNRREFIEKSVRKKMFEILKRLERQENFNFSALIDYLQKSLEYVISEENFQREHSR